MFRKKAAGKAMAAAATAAAATATTAPSGTTPTNNTEKPPASSRTPRTRGSKAKTLALIEKHRRILEEAQRQKEEMDSITEEHEQLQEHRQRAAAAAAAASSATASPQKKKEAALEAAGADPAVAAVSQDVSRPDAFTALIEQFLAATEPLADLDETLQQEAPALTSSTGAAESSAAATPTTAAVPRARASSRPPILTYRSFSASLLCPKKFYLLQNRADLIPKASLGERMHFDDSVGFNELARRWDRLQFGSRAYLVKESDFDQAVQHTEQLITSYFQGPYASLGEQAPSLTIHRPAFAVEFTGAAGVDGASSSSGSQVSSSVELRARPTVVRYRPKENQWVFIDSQAVIDPVSTSARITHTIQKFHFTILCFRLWLMQPHLPIEVRKKFFQVNLDGINAENSQGRSLESSARPAAPIDLKRSGLLHIRQFFPGPATLVDCTAPQLVKFIQRLSLEELLEEDSKHYGKEGGGRGHSYAGGFYGGGAFDLRNCHRGVSQNLALSRFAGTVDTAAQELNKAAHTRTTRSQKHKDEALHRSFEAQQHFMEVFLRQHILPLMVQQQQQLMTPSSSSGSSTEAQSLTAFSKLMGDAGFVHAASSSAPLEEDRGKKTVKAAARKVKAGAKGRQKNPTGGEDDLSGAVDSGVATANGGDESDGRGPGVPSYGCHIGTQCLRGGDACPFFVEGMCLPRKVEDPVTARDNHLFTLPSTSLARKSAWWAEGKRTVKDVLNAYERSDAHMRMTHAQLRYANALTQGQLGLNPKEIDAFFAKIRYPLFVIDFEAVQFALPPFQKEVAYQSIPFQFSLDVFQHDVLTEEPTHYNYLHFGKGCSPNTDPRPGCVAELLRVVRLEREKKRAAMEASGELARIEAEKAAAAAEAAAEAAGGAPRRGRKPKEPKKPKITKGTPLEEPLRPYDGSFIAHFASFEKSCLEKLGQLEEQYKEEIKEFFFLDTLDLIKKGCVHPNAHGSNSLKKVLPALCPGFQYGVFGSETDPADAPSDARGDAGEAGAVEGQDEQKGENAMGVYRLWYHLEGGGTVQDLQRATRGTASTDGSSPASEWTESVRTTMSKEERERMWETLRTQLLEYCSLDTKALYEIMREIHRQRSGLGDAKPHDKNGWVFSKPPPRELDF